MKDVWKKAIVAFVILMVVLLTPVYKVEMATELVIWDEPSNGHGYVYYAHWPPLYTQHEDGNTFYVDAGGAMFHRGKLFTFYEPVQRYENAIRQRYECYNVPPQQFYVNQLQLLKLLFASTKYGKFLVDGKHKIEQCSNIELN